MPEIWDNETLTKKVKDLQQRMKRLERAFKKPKKKRSKARTQARSQDA